MTSVPTSLVVCSRDRPEMLRESLESILRGDELPTELIILDQSREPNLEVANLAAPLPCELRYIHSDSTGLSCANNLAVGAASHDLLVFTHDDVLVEPSWFGAIRRAQIEAGERAVVTGRILAGRASGGGYAPALRVGITPEVYRGRLGYDVLKPLNMAIPRAALEEIGGFDERLGPGTPFPGAEDADLGFRLLEAGYEIHYVPEALLYHRAWRTEDEYLPLRWRYGVAQGAFYAKHFRRHDPHMLIRWLRDGLRRMRRFPGRLLSEGSRAFGDVLFMSGNLVGAVRWIRGVGGDRRRQRRIPGTAQH